MGLEPRDMQVLTLGLKLKMVVNSCDVKCSSWISLCFHSESAYSLSGAVSCSGGRFLLALLLYSLVRHEVIRSVCIICLLERADCVPAERSAQHTDRSSENKWNEKCVVSQSERSLRVSWELRLFDLGAFAEGSVCWLEFQRRRSLPRSTPVTCYSSLTYGCKRADSERERTAIW